MKAIVCPDYGTPDVPKCEEVEKPVPKDDEVLIRVRAASANPADMGFRGTSYIIRMLMTGLRKPKDTRLGHDVAGEVEAVGRNVTQFKQGDAVFGLCSGSFAEYVCASESAVAMKPDNVTFEQAAAAPVAAFTALQGLRDKGQIRPGQRILINGASGGVGTFTVQFAKWFGADVTGVCSTRNVEMVRSIGADRVIDYTAEDFTKGGQRYDLIFDCAGNRPLSACRRVLNPKGICVLVGAPPKISLVLVRVLGALALSWFVSQKFVVFIAKRNKEDLNIMHDLMKAGKVVPVIGRRYSLSEVPEAMRYLEERHARGKIVIVLS